MSSRTAPAHRFSAWLTLCVLSVAHVAQASERIYVVDDEATGLQLTDQPHGAGSRLLIDAPVAAAGAPAVAASPAALPPSQGAVVAAVNRAARAHAIEPELIHAVIATESAYAVRAISPRGALGLMQLMPATARSYGVTDAFDVAQNVNAGVLHLRRLLDRFGQNKALALAAYNAGEGAVMRHGQRIPPFAETTAYVQRVLQRHAALRTATVHPLPARDS